MSPEGPSTEWLSAVTRLDPPRRVEAPPSWEEAVQVLARHGLAAIAAYNLHYRMPDTAVPESASDVLLGYHQGLLNDNVFKLVTAKQLLGPLAGPRVVLLDAASYAEALYPHIGFRPIPELRLLVAPGDLQEVVAALADGGFAPAEPEEPDPDRPAAVLYNQRFFAKVYTHLLPRAEAEAGLLSRSVKALAMGAAVHRLAAEDALVVQVLSMARRGFAVPLISYVDLREIVRGASATASRGGPGSPLDPAVVRDRVAAAGAERALHAALELLVHFHPDVEAQAAALRPHVNPAVRALIDATVVAPARDPERSRQLRGVETLQRLLLG